MRKCPKCNHVWKDDVRLCGHVSTKTKKVCGGVLIVNADLIPKDTDAVNNTRNLETKSDNGE